MSLTKTEQGYAQIEKELLGILFGCKRFHQYTYARPIRVHTDHKPIVSIMKKPLSAASPRLRMLLQLQSYDLDEHFVPGKEIPLSDSYCNRVKSCAFAMLSSIAQNVPLYYVLCLGQ